MKYSYGNIHTWNKVESFQTQIINKERLLDCLLNRKMKKEFSVVLNRPRFFFLKEESRDLFVNLTCLFQSFLISFFSVFVVVHFNILECRPRFNLVGLDNH